MLHEAVFENSGVDCSTRENGIYFYQLTQTGAFCGLGKIEKN